MLQYNTVINITINYTIINRNIILDRKQKQFLRQHLFKSQSSVRRLLTISKNSHPHHNTQEDRWFYFKRFISIHMIGRRRDALIMS